eukprot:TRINITY_DN1657_c0_g1_i1.p2 TRINITY_DN1657_c0_g1~~TRINITY_DN1657_c0_g1_i1.p2  ORF type:complete len:179 (-),score=24.55 TRINITY_DN1657_c0_g1_i1:108-644(-)
MGNAHVFLRFYDPETEEPYYSKIQLGEHIKWHQMQQHAFDEFKPYFAPGVDPTNLHFMTQLDNSNIELLIPNGDTLRGLISDFVKMEKGGHLAVLDVIVEKPGYEQRKIENKMRKDHLLKEFQHNLNHQQAKEHTNVQMSAMMDQHWNDFHQQNQDRFSPENKYALFQEFQQYLATKQ